MRSNPREIANLVPFTEKILNGKLHFLCSIILENMGRRKRVFWHILRGKLQSTLTKLVLANVQI